MDRITKSYLNNFIDQFAYENSTKALSDNFERFCAYLILSRDLPNQSLNREDFDSTSTGSNKGIDSVCLIVNGKLVSSIQAIDDLKKINGYIELSLIFIQSKTSSSFSDSEIGNFSDTVKDFLSENPKYSLTNEAQYLHELFLHILDDFAVVKSFNCTCYYCTSGKWNKNTSCNKTIDIKREEIKAKYSYFIDGDFNIRPLGSTEIQTYYNKINSALKATFAFNNKVSLDTTLPEIKEAYYGFLPFNEFKKIIIDKDSGELRSLFYDNVRDDLGENNPVNSDIAKTLDDKHFSIFSLLNNGVTIIAEENKGGGNNFILNNYQIVNGCQTSNVLFNHKDLVGMDKLNVPVKLIITSNEEIKDKIILATNNQTAIKEEQRMALTTFQKGLEKFYSTMPDNIHYERRVNQFSSTTIKKKNIINLREQIKTFVAVFMEKPHLVSGYFGKVYREYKDNIFIEEHKHEPYYFSALIQHKFKSLLYKKEINRKYNKARYHIFFLFRKVFEPETFSTGMLKQKKIVKYTRSLLEQLSDDKVKSNFDEIIAIIDKSSINIEDQKEMYKKSTTHTLIRTYKEEYE